MLITIDSVCGIAIRRTLILAPLLASSDYTWDATEQFYWCSAEVNGGILCASVPALKPFFVRYLPAFVNSRLRSSNNNSKPGTSGTRGTNGLNTVVERNKERRQLQEQSYELHSQDDLSWENGYRGHKKQPDDDEAKLWNGNTTRKTGNNRTTTTVVGTNRKDMDSSSVDTDEGATRITIARNSGGSQKNGINVKHETRVEYSPR